MVFFGNEIELFYGPTFIHQINHTKNVKLQTVERGSKILYKKSYKYLVTSILSDLPMDFTRTKEAKHLYLGDVIISCFPTNANKFNDSNVEICKKTSFLETFSSMME